MTSLVAARRPQHGEPASTLAAVRAQLVVVAALLAAAGAAWWATAERMAGMDAGPGTDLGTPGWFVGAWSVMMAAMLLPSLAPTAAVYAALARRRGPLGAVWFAGGYLLVWSAAGVVAYATFVLGRHAFGSEFEWRAGGRWLAAGVLAAAALYELTPLKGACLMRCRRPLRFLRGRWREGGAGAFAMGARNGTWCVGCSWALMAALFALGVMSLTWMALVGVLVAFEKVAPWRGPAVLVTMALLLTLAAAIVLAPQEVPGLVVPGGAMGAAHAMHGMGG